MRIVCKARRFWLFKLVPWIFLSLFKQCFSHVRDQLLFAILSALYIKASNRSWLGLLLPAVKEGENEKGSRVERIRRKGE